MTYDKQKTSAERCEEALHELTVSPNEFSLRQREHLANNIRARLAELEAENRRLAAKLKYQTDEAESYLSRVMELEDRASKWIPVTESLPPLETTCWVTTSAGTVATATYTRKLRKSASNKIWKQLWVGRTGNDMQGVTHYALMQVPLPPKEGGEK